MFKFLFVALVLYCGNVFAEKNDGYKKDSLELSEIYIKSKQFLETNTDSARVIAIKGIKFSRKINNIKGAGDGFFYIALSYDIDNITDSAIAYYSKSLSFFKKINSHKACAVTLCNLGDIYLRDSKIDMALSSYNFALQYFEIIKFNEGISRINFNLGIIFKLTSNYQKACDYFFIVLKNSESLRDTFKMALTYREIGNIYFLQKKYFRSNYYYSKALKIIGKIESNKYLNLIADLKCNLGCSYENLEDFNSAMKVYSEAIIIYQKIHNFQGEGTVYLNQGELMNKMKKHIEALKYNSKSLEIFNKINDQYSIAYTNYNRGSIFRGMNLYDSALHLFNKALIEAKQISDKNLIKSIIEESSMAYEAIGDYKKAYKNLMLFKTLSDSLYNDEITRKITTIELQYDFYKKQKNIETLQKQKDFVNNLKLKKKETILKTSILFFVLVLLLFFTGFGYYRNKQLAKIKGMELELNRSIQQALSQQMNPHFIFNCLNSIKALILDNKIEETEKYFGVFTSLMRKNLEYSQVPSISVKDEIDALKLYVEIEKLRFNNQFVFVTNIDEDLDQCACKIPSLLLQPFVENAIIHGLRTKIGQGMITVSIILSGKEILCSIDDNGVGRDSLLGNNNENKHKSYGIAITKRRLALIYKLYGNATELVVFDKKSPDGTSIGTCVKFGIPIIL